MPRFALLVTLRTHPGRGDELVPLLREAAAAAVREEPDCHAFHVGRSEDDPDEFRLFEVYTDAAALEFHHGQPHFARFAEAAGPLIASKARTRLDLE